MLILRLVLEKIPMERIKLHDKTFKTFIPYERIIASIDEVAAKLMKTSADARTFRSFFAC